MGSYFIRATPSLLADCRQPFNCPTGHSIAPLGTRERVVGNIQYVTDDTGGA
jgi:hypothetical protein